MTCREFQNLLLDHAAGELLPQVEQAFQRHRSACAPCRRQVDAYLRTIAFARDAHRESHRPIELPTDLVFSVLATLEAIEHE